MNEQDNTSGLLGILGKGQVDANIKVQLSSEQYIYLGLAMLVGVLLGSLFADVLKKMLGTS